VIHSFARAASAATALAVVGVMVGGVPASAATVGVGTTNTKTSVLTLELGQNGSLLDLGLLTDTGGANIDPHAGTLNAGASLVPVTLSSSALNLHLSTPAISTLQPGGSAAAAGQALTLGALGVPAALATATIKPAALASSYVAGAAHSTMSAAEIDNLTLAGGALASIDLLSSTLGADALTGQADGTRGVQVGTIKLLDLGALLKGLGIDLTSLPIGALSQLASQLNLPLPDLAGGSDLASEVASLSAALTSLRQSLVTATTTVTQPVDALAQSLLGQLDLPIPTVGSLVTTLNATIATVQTDLTTLLTTVLSSLDSIPLVQISGTSLGISTTAADTVSDSSAAVTVAPLTITVAGITLPTINPEAAVSTVNGVLAQANNALNNLLGSLGLPANLLSLSLLDQAHSVSQEFDYTSAAAGVTMLTAKIAAINPAVITAALSKLTGTTASSLLGSTPLGSLLGSSNAMAALDSLLGQAAPLLGGAQLQIASLAGASTYTFAPVPGAPTTTPMAAPPVNLPHTGANPELAIAGVILFVMALAAARWRRAIRLQPLEVRSTEPGASRPASRR